MFRFAIILPLAKATAAIDYDRWTLLKGSVLGIVEDVGVSQKAKTLRMSLPIDNNGKLLEDTELGECSPSFAGSIVMKQSNNGSIDRKDKDGNPVDFYRKKNDDLWVTRWKAEKRQGFLNNIKLILIIKNVSCLGFGLAQSGFRTLTS